MKKFLLNSSINILRKNGNYSEEDIEIIIYGLEGIYLTLTKMVVIFSLAYVLNLWKEVLLLLITFNIIRSQAFGLHASKSIYCLILSIFMLLGGAIICKYVTFSEWFLTISAVICNICLLLYAPADTHNRPIVNLKKRKKFKYISFSIGIIYTFFIILFRNSYIANYLLFGMIEAVFMILPISYSIFKLPYNNYKTYCSNV